MPLFAFGSFGAIEHFLDAEVLVTASSTAQTVAHASVHLAIVVWNNGEQFGENG